MLKSLKKSTEYVVIWIPNSTEDISMDYKEEFAYRIEMGYYLHQDYKKKEFENKEDAEKFVNELLNNTINILF